MLKKEVVLIFITFLASNSLAFSRNGLDEKFKLGRKAEGGRAEKTEIEKIYKDFFAKSMYSKCQWFPSDSEFLKIKTKQCGQARGSLLAIGRFLAEPDASQISVHPINDRNRLRFVNLRESCEIL